MTTFDWLMERAQY